MKTIVRRVDKLEEANRFTVTTPADLLAHPWRIAVVRAEMERSARLLRGGERRLATIVMGFSDALLVDYLFFENEIAQWRADGATLEEMWEKAMPWWLAAYEREPELVSPAIEEWRRDGILIETTGGVE